MIAAASEQIASANGIEIAYDSFGDPSDPALLLIMGLGMQLTAWDPEFCKALAGRGFHVIRFDNRDVGHSTKIEGGPKPKPVAAMLGFTASRSYDLRDMAADTAGLLDHLGIERAHVAGASLGGMIAQTLAIQAPEKVASLCSIMSTSGARFVGIPRFAAMRTLLTPSPSDRDAYGDWSVAVFKVIGSPGYPTDEQQLRERSLAMYDRSRYPRGVERQLVACMNDDRTKQLRKLGLPTVVIHGKADPLIPIRAGRATAKAIRGAKLVEIDGMGHDFPPALWPRYIDEIVANAERERSAQPVAG